ncbi:MAG: arginine--tRNA ligase [Candidatus Binataceae bacterium]|nr:arginine--tRNA ligase [Candidatus Binataceae bacterium]
MVVAILRAALDQAQAQGKLKSVPASIGVEAPRDPAHGDIASNVALTMARAEGQPPRAIAEIILERIELSRQVLEAKVAGPGFINFKMAPGYWQVEIRRAVREGDRFWRPQIGEDKKVQVEFLSANPTGPLTVGHGRNAVLGDTIARLYEATGHRVTREYYFNDGGRQMKLLGESVQARYLEQIGRKVEFPEDGYHGEYIREIAAGLHRVHGPALADQNDIAPFRAAAVDAIFADIKHTCERLSVRFEVYANELDLIRGGAVEAALAGLRERGLIAEYDGAVWLRAEPLKLPKDAVLVRRTGEPTYRTPDIAYHVEKLKRGFDQIIDVFGADHIAEHDEVIAAVRALGYDTAPIRAIIYQFVTLTRGGEKVKMSTRKATYVTLEELIDEVGADVVRFFFMFRKSDSHLDFDLDLAKRQAPENPVFYVQYAHARLCSVFREAEKAGYESTAASLDPDLTLLSEEEFALAKRAVGMPAIIAAATLELEPHRIPFYLLETAAEFHRYYNKPSNRIIGPDRALSMARLYLCELLRDALCNGLELIGVSAPERM